MTLLPIALLVSLSPPSDMESAKQALIGVAWEVDYAASCDILNRQDASTLRSYQAAGYRIYAKLDSDERLRIWYTRTGRTRRYTLRVRLLDYQNGLLRIQAARGRRSGGFSVKFLKDGIQFHQPGGLSAILKRVRDDQD